MYIYSLAHEEIFFLRLEELHFIFVIGVLLWLAELSEMNKFQLKICNVGV